MRLGEDLWSTLDESSLWGVFDVELTNRCNASCAFCPRDVTPGQGVMSDDVFARTLERVVELRESHGDLFHHRPSVSFCGLGEQLLNRSVADYVRRVREADLGVAVTSNASLLDEARATALLDAGLTMLFVNGGEKDESYEEVYHLPFERTRDNLVRFRDMARGRCGVIIVLVDHRGDEQHTEDMERYWRDLGFGNFMTFPMQNRGGSLPLESQTYQHHPHVAAAAARLARHRRPAVCQAPFQFPFVGWDGRYYLCSSDWQKEVPLGSVFDRSFADVTAEKLRITIEREPVCRTCTHDPVNRMADLMAAVEAGAEQPEMVDVFDAGLAEGTEMFTTLLERFGLELPPTTSLPPVVAPTPRRPLIPVEAI